MRKSFGLAMILAVSTVVTGEDKKPSLDGIYVLTGMEIYGNKVPDENLKAIPAESRTLEIKGEKMIRPTPMGPLEMKIDSTKTPAWITTTDKKGNVSPNIYGIYKVEGDTLTICLVEHGEPADRPKEFKTAKDSEAVLMTFKKKGK